MNQLVLQQLSRARKLATCLEAVIAEGPQLVQVLVADQTQLTHGQGQPKDSEVRPNVCCVQDLSKKSCVWVVQCARAMYVQIAWRYLYQWWDDCNRICSRVPMAMHWLYPWFPTMKNMARNLWQNKAVKWGEDECHWKEIGSDLWNNGGKDQQMIWWGNARDFDPSGIQSWDNYGS